MVASLPEDRRRRSVIRCYVTKDQKAVIAALARRAGLSESDLARLLLVTATPRIVAKLRRHRAWRSLREAEAERR